jgi:hypothetical protein
MVVEGVSYNVNWKTFRRGTSFFIPCLNTAKARRKILVTTNRLCIEVLAKVVIEEGIKGLRIWKV